MMETYKTFYASPLGTLTISSDGVAITALLFPKDGQQEDESSGTPPEVVQDCIQQLDAYFAGSLQTFELPMAQHGTAFQQSVWNNLCAIPYGKTCSYLELARRIGNEKSIRAVGTTNGKNQLGIIVPCHRVIGTNGSLTGYAGGLWRKQWLLAHERKIKYGIQTLF